jgi:pterin-4a-carbinolamine dehydratase
VSRPEPLGASAVAAFVAATDWRLEGGHLVREVALPDYQHGVDLVVAQGALAASLDHHATLTLGYATLRVDLWTHDRGAITALDVRFATAFDELVARVIS